MKESLKNTVKKILHLYGYEVIKKGGKKGRGSFNGILQHIKKMGIQPQTVFDVGVASGTFELYENFPNAYHLLIEPLKEYEGELKKICKRYKAEYVLAAAGERSGKIIINVHPKELQGSSVLKQSEGKFADGNSREVPILSIDELCEKKTLIEPFLIKVDVQGAELTVLKGAKKTLEYTEIVILEARLYESYKNAPELVDLLDSMKSYGFVPYDFFGFLYRPLDNALHGMDIVFTRENSILRECKCFTSLEQRESMVT